jgi:hypothetical protein
MTYRRVFLWLFVFAFAPELIKALRWSLPVVLDLGTQPAAEALAQNLIAVALTAALVYWALLVATALWHRLDRARRR